MCTNVFHMGFFYIFIHINNFPQSYIACRSWYIVIRQVVSYKKNGGGYPYFYEFCLASNTDVVK
jgi:hypothetical protein